jgi:outer membrane protein assembly factor BamB
VPVAGFNSPIVWGDRIFLSGGDATKREVLCFGSRGGELLWRQTIEKQTGPAGEPAEIPEHTGYAASTMATDGRRVYAIFATADLVALTLDGKQVWAKNLGIPRNPHGHASSLVTWQGRLIVQMDQGDAEDNISKLYAFDGPTGRALWQRSRPVSVSWATPLVVEAAGKTQIITFAVPWAIAYAVTDGTELWRVEGLNGEVTASPAFAGGFALALSPHEKMMAIRPDGQGDVSNSHVAWTAEEDMPDICSPATDGELVFTLSSSGTLACYEAKDGTKVWEQELEMEANASPTIAGDRLYVVGAKGTVVAANVGREFKELGRSGLGEPVHASPAFVNGRIYIRGEKHLFAIGMEERLAAQ